MELFNPLKCFNSVTKNSDQVERRFVVECERRKLSEQARCAPEYRGILWKGFKLRNPARSSTSETRSPEPREWPRGTRHGSACDHRPRLCEKRSSDRGCPRDTDTYTLKNKKKLILQKKICVTERVAASADTSASCWSSRRSFSPSVSRPRRRYCFPHESRLLAGEVKFHSRISSIN